MANAQGEYTDKKQEIKDIIRRVLKYREWWLQTTLQLPLRKDSSKNLKQIKIRIEEHFHKSLSSIDNAYIDTVYITYCIEFWLEEIINLLNSHTKSESRNVIQDVINSQDDIQKLSQIPDALQKNEFYLLLVRHQTLVDEKSAIRRFRKMCLEQIVAINASVGKELVFLETCVSVLTSSKFTRSIISELKLTDLCSGKLEFVKFLEVIAGLDFDRWRSRYPVNDIKFATLQEVAKCLQQEKELILVEKFKEEMRAYIRPVMIQKVSLDGRFVVEVVGRSVIASEILSTLETHFFGDSSIEEVRLVGGDIVHIDTNLESEFWQGKNIVVMTKVLKIHNNPIWNVSGKDSAQFYTCDAGTGEDGHGNQGKDGYPGESGGNVLIIVDKAEKLENLTIISNGGKGSKGQDGGGGRGGADGQGIKVNDFNSLFPPAAPFALSLALSYLIKTLESIRSNLKVMKIEWYYRYFVTRVFQPLTEFNQNVIEKVIEDCGTGFAGDIFINAITNEGNEITFSFKGVTRQAYFLYKGSKGTPGCPGGGYGLGGQGGYPGEVTVKLFESNQNSNIVPISKQGEQGENGQGGLYGKHGKNGWDMGYMDYQFSTFISETWPKIFGTNYNEVLSFESYADTASNRIWCPYKKTYVMIRASRIDHTQQAKYEERKSAECEKENSSRLHHSQAVRKKGISMSSISAKYSHHLNSLETLQSLRFDLESSRKLALLTVAENQEQQKKQTERLGVRRHMHFSNRSRKAVVKTTKHFSDLIIWFVLKIVQLVGLLLYQLFKCLRYLWTTFFWVEQNLGKLSINMKRLVTLQEIAKQIPPVQYGVEKIDLSAARAVRYLVQEKEKDNNVSHPILGTLNQYIFRNSEVQLAKVVQFCKEKLQHPVDEALKRSIDAFVWEIGESDTGYTTIKRYRDECEHYNQLNREYDWEKCCKDQHVLKTFHDYIEANGPVAKCCRELLAYVFDVNISMKIEERDC